MSDPEGGEEPERGPFFLYRNLEACLFTQRKGSELFVITEALRHAQCI
jgi:hypothetical protein